tara:strand:+ start:351 stop:701 length:351 start_codon:yes stop_codon:yes gene_type:complete
MATFEELARRYADEILTNARVTVLKEATGVQEVRKSVDVVLSKIEGLTYADGIEKDQGLNQEDEHRLYELIDVWLKVQTGTIRQLKEGSAQGLLDRHHSVWAALTRIQQASQESSS